EARRCRGARERTSALAARREDEGEADRGVLLGLEREAPPPDGVDDAAGHLLVAHRVLVDADLADLAGGHYQEAHHDLALQRRVALELLLVAGLHALDAHADVLAQRGLVDGGAS